MESIYVSVISVHALAPCHLLMVALIAHRFRTAYAVYKQVHISHQQWWSYLYFLHEKYRATTILMYRIDITYNFGGKWKIKTIYIFRFQLHTATSAVSICWRTLPHVANTAKIQTDGASDESDISKWRMEFDWLKSTTFFGIQRIVMIQKALN